VERAIASNLITNFIDVGAPPTLQVARASGVSEVEADGPVLRCLVCGSFQPFLEALRGYEVISLTSTLATL
jgi:hypothetical protein